MNSQQKNTRSLTRESNGNNGQTTTDDLQVPVETNQPNRQNLYRQMLEIRCVEETLLQLFSEGLLRGTVHTCIGQEATAVGVVSVLDRTKDIICSNHRGHGHYLAYTQSAKPLIAEVMGLESGVCGGVGGSQHLQFKNFYANGILGGMIPVATGMALAEKAKETGAIVVAFLGDGAFGEGIVYESLNMAALWKLPILFAVEQNFYAQSTPFELEHAGRLQDRAKPFGIPVAELDGNDVEQVHNEASEAVTAIRRGDGPRLLFMETYRLAAHSKGDDDREPTEIEDWRKREPLVRARAALTDPWCDEVETQTRSRIAAVVDELKIAAGAS